LVRLIERKSFSVFWSFGKNSMRLYKDGMQIFESPQEVHKRGNRVIDNLLIQMSLLMLY
jgi:hypothetical protein